MKVHDKIKCRWEVKMRKKRQSSYGTDVFDMPMALDNPSTLNKKGLKKRRNWKRRGLLD